MIRKNEFIPINNLKKKEEERKKKETIGKMKK